MKILTNFDKAVADVLADKVKARLTFKVRSGIRCMSSVGACSLQPVVVNTDLCCAGPPRYLPLLRRRLDLHYQGHQLQARQHEPSPRRPRQDRQLQHQAPG